ncbi:MULTISPECIES: BatD family protein [unclassified Halobacteriovorax]|uniref:BatD family protein n=1 Tax=unclassified Halobacteriovorax TaxID=2639665 RepID=UPI00399B10D4
MFKYIVLFLLTFSSLAQTITAKISSSEVSLEDSFKLIINFEYQGETEPYVNFKLNNAEIVSDNTNDASRLMIKGYFAGGKMVQKKVYNYVYELRAIKTGSAVIRDIKVDFGAQVVKHRSLTVRVLSQRARLQDYFVRAEVDKTQAYVGEKIDLVYYIYFKGQISNPEFVKFPVQKNFLKRFELPRSSVESVSIQGEIYKRAALYKSVLYPEKAGDLSIDPVEIRFQHPDYTSRRGNAFGMSFTFSTGSEKTKVLRSDRVKIKALPIPVENMPKSFTGLVGKHTFNLSLNKSKIVVNDVLEARLEIRGDGALEKFDAPRLITSDAFEVFETRAEMIEQTALVKNKVFDYTFLAKRAEFVSERKIELSTFNPLTGNFETTELTIDPLIIIGSGSAASNIASDETKDVVKKVQQTAPAEVKTVVSGNIMAPVFTNSKKKNLWDIINYSLIGIAAFVIALTAFPYIRFFDRDPFKNLKREFNYSNIFHHITTFTPDVHGDSLNDRIKGMRVSPEARKYFNDLVDNAGKNEYKGAKLPLKYKKEYWQELARANNENN